MKRLFVQVHSETQILFGVGSGIASEQKKKNNPTSEHCPVKI